MQKMPLKLIDVTARLAQMVRTDRRALARDLLVSIPKEWPEFPHAFEKDRFGGKPDDANAWGGFFFLDEDRAALVGNGGFKGAPDAKGMVEIGYEVAPAHRRLGYATQATRQLLAHAFGHSAVKSVVAHTLASSDASAGVLKKTGFKLVNEIPNDKLGPILKWEKTR